MCPFADKTGELSRGKRADATILWTNEEVPVASRAIKSRANIKKKHPSTAVIAVAAVVFAFIVSLCWGIWSVGSSWLSDLPD